MFNLTSYCGDSFWDADLSWNTTTPQLTSCFRHTALTWPGPALLLLSLPFLLSISPHQGSRKFRWRFHSLINQGFALGLAGAASIDLFVGVQDYFNSEHLIAHVVTPFIRLLFALTLEAIFYRYPTFDVRINATLWTVLGLSFFCSVLQIFSWNENEWKNPSLSIVTYCLNLALWAQTFKSQTETKNPPCTSANQSRYELASSPRNRSNETIECEGESTNQCPKETASFFSIMFFSWFSSLPSIGRGRPLVMSDLWKTRPIDSAQVNYEFFRKYVDDFSKTNAESDDFDAENEKPPLIPTKNDAKTPKINILRIIWASYRNYFLFGALFKLIQDCIMFVSPLIMKQLMLFVNDASEAQWHGYVFAIGLFLVNCCQTTCYNFYFGRMQIFGLRVRTQLAAAIYRKVLKLSNGARNRFTTGEIVNLMSVDVQRFADIALFINVIWAAPIQIGITLYFLWLELGIAVFGGFCFMLILIPINGYLSGLARQLQVRQMKLKDERVKAMSEMLSGMKVIKLYGWEVAFIKRIQDIRQQEISVLRQINFVNCVPTVLWNLTPILISLVSFSLYVFIDEERVLSPEKAFVSIALFNILRFPLTMLPNLVTFITTTSVSVNRLNNFLNAEELSQYITPLDSNSVNCVELSNCSFRWSKPGLKTESEEKHRPEQVILTDLNLRIKTGQFVAIVGGVGSGKTSLVESILGNMELISGNISVSNQRLSYTPQEAWIQNSTLRDNILFGEVFDEELYHKVIKSCCLLPDLEVLPGGDLTEIGEKGINLSGGQKQRVSLARACYAKADIYLLDDPLAAVDSHVGKSIFENILHSDSGILKHKTRILVTNNLSILPYADLVVVLKDGRIIERGCYRDLIEMKTGYLAHFIQQYATHGENEEEDAAEVTSSSSSCEEDSKKKNSQPKKLIESETIEAGGVKWSVYSRYLRSITLFWTFLFIISQIIGQSSNVGSNLWLAVWANSSEDDPESESGTFFFLSIYGGIGVLQIIFSIISYYSLITGILRAALDLHNKMLDNIMRLGMTFFDVTPLGRVLNRFSTDINVCDNTIQSNIRIMSSSFFSTVATILVILGKLPIFFVVILPMSATFLYIRKLFVSTARQLKRLETTTKSPIFSHFSETLSGVATIRAYSVDQQFIGTSDSHMDVNNACCFATMMSARWLAVRLEYVANLMCLFVAGFAVYDRESLDAASVGLMITYVLNTTQQFNFLVRYSSEIEKNIVSVERILEYTDLPVEAEWNIEEAAQNSHWPSEGVLEFRNYSTRYRAGLDLALKNIRVHIRQGEKVGIVGRTGAGKSSLTLALFRLIEPANGIIIIDGVDISTLGLHQLRQHLTIIPQDPVLFSGTLRTNLDPFNKQTDSQLWSALELAHLKSFVQNCTGGLDYCIAESGANLSMGQRQLVCLARALLRKSKILVLDETTATVDIETDKLIGKTIREAFEDCTILTIAHRLHTIMDSDRVMVLHNGEVAEFDKPDRLLADSTSIFFSMAQAAGISRLEALRI